MKLKSFSKIITVSTFGAAFALLSSCKDAAETASNDSASPETAATAETAAKSDSPAEQATNTANTVPVYIFNVTGKG